MRVIFTTISVVLFLLPVWTDATQHTSFACEHQTPVRVSCPAHYVIDVQDAFYGRLEKDRCGWNKNDHCKAGNSLTIIKENCQNENSCILKAHNSVFGDPCHGVVKYIKFVYECVPEELYFGETQTVYACEHETPEHVRCPEYYVIDVIDAFYGRQEKDRCGWNANDQCKAGSSLSKIKQNCQYENSCTLKAHNSVFGDPCRGVVKYIKLIYQCVPIEEERVAIACEHEADVTVSCPHGYVISVYEAFYGRDDLTTCYRYAQTNTNCKANGSYEKIRHACDYKNSCVLWAKNSKFGDPCHGVRKFVKMNYSCIPQYH
ncbi:L-rhamnose-binding lectin CSL3-like [Clavelina lepadiformis]|uniref:L-rhamnose-binding lectin CSL3-like n=1 Tax=Clavelina lepadiformis TaxID=159417 RepID=UPI00404376F3